MFDLIKAPLSDLELYHYHYLITYSIILIWGLFGILGFFIQSKKNIIKITYFLIGISAFQEIFDYTNRFFINDLYKVSIITDLPLQLCHVAYWFSVICLIMSVSYKTYKYKNYFFSCAYIFGFAAFQGILTVDLTGLYTFGDILALHLQHSIIILNIIWLIIVFRFKLNVRGIFQAFLTINILAAIIGLINYLLNSNYMFLCKPPNVDNILIAGEWPYYIIVIEILFIIIGYLLYIPFKIIEKLTNKD